MEDGKGGDAGNSSKEEHQSRRLAKWASIAADTSLAVPARIMSFRTKPRLYSRR
jgi:hypothetical protein